MRARPFHKKLWKGGPRHGHEHGVGEKSLRQEALRELGDGSVGQERHSG